MKHLARLIDAALNLYAPTVHVRSAAAYTTNNPADPDADLLADAEAHTEVWDPHELHAAMDRHPVGKHRTEIVLQPGQTADQYIHTHRHLFAVPDEPPAGAGAAPSPGGHPSESTELALAITIGHVLRNCETPWPATTAGIVARELLHHYTIHPK